MAFSYRRRVKLLAPRAREDVLLVNDYECHVVHRRLQK